MLIVGGTISFLIARTVNAASMAPAAPSKCPVIDLVELIARLYAWSPYILFIAIVSYLSFSGVEVPCALM